MSHCIVLYTTCPYMSIVCTISISISSVTGCYAGVQLSTVAGLSRCSMLTVNQLPVHVVTDSGEFICYIGVLICHVTNILNIWGTLVFDSILTIQDEWDVSERYWPGYRCDCIISLSVSVIILCYWWWNYILDCIQCGGTFDWFL